MGLIIAKKRGDDPDGIIDVVETAFDYYKDTYTFLYAKNNKNISRISSKDKSFMKEQIFDYNKITKEDSFIIYCSDSYEKTEGIPYQKRMPVSLKEISTLYNNIDYFSSFVAIDNYSYENGKTQAELNLEEISNIFSKKQALKMYLKAPKMFLKKFPEYKVSGKIIMMYKRDIFMPNENLFTKHKNIYMSRPIIIRFNSDAKEEKYLNVDGIDIIAFLNANAKKVKLVRKDDPKREFEIQHLNFKTGIISIKSIENKNNLIASLASVIKQNYKVVFK